MAAESQETFGPASGVKYRVGVTLAMVRRDVLRGSVRKSMASVDHSDGELGRSLAYFQILLEEVRSESFPPRKPHLEFKLEDCERFQRGIGPTQGQGVPAQILHRLQIDPRVANDVQLPAGKCAAVGTISVSQ